MIDFFDARCPAARGLLLSGSERDSVEADWTQFNATLGGATAAFAYFHFLPHRAIMIRLGGRPITRPSESIRSSVERTLWQEAANCFSRGAPPAMGTPAGALRRRRTWQMRRPKLRRTAHSIGKSARATRAPACRPSVFFQHRSGGSSCCTCGHWRTVSRQQGRDRGQSKRISALTNRELRTERAAPTRKPKASRKPHFARTASVPIAPNTSVSRRTLR